MSRVRDYETPPQPADAALPGARTALFLLAGINLFNYLDRYILAAVEPEIRQFIQGKALAAGHPLTEAAAKAMTGSLAMAFLISYTLAAPIFGLLADRMSRWLLVGISVGLWSLASGATGLGIAFAAIWCTRIFVGIGEAGYGPSAPTIISDLYPLRRRSSVLAWFYMAIPVGSALGYVFGGMFTHDGMFSSFFGWRGAFFAVVAPGLLLAVLCFLMKDPPRGQSDAAVAHKVSLADYFLLFKTPSYVLDTLGMAAMTFAIGGMAFWMPGYLNEARRVGSLEMVNRYFGIIMVVTGVTATLAGGIVGDKLRKRFAGSYFLVSAAGIFLSVICIFLMLRTPFPRAWIWLALALFWLFFNTGPSNTILANVIHPSMRATAFAFNIFLIHVLGDVPSPPLLGYISGRWGWGFIFSLVCGMMVLGGLFWLWGASYLAADTERAPRSLGERIV